MKFGLVALFTFLFVSTGYGCDSSGEEECLICRNVHCKCSRFGCGDDEKMSLKKLILHFIQRSHKRSQEDEEDDVDKPLVRVLKDILKRASCHNINEERSIRDLILTRLNTLNAKCPCIEEPNEARTRRFLKLLLEKCLECDCGEIPCECMWSKKTCDPDDGIYWFRTTDDQLRAERPKRECCGIFELEPSDCPVRKQREQGVCNTRNVNPHRRCGVFDDNYKCPRFIGDESDRKCNEFSICTDCDDCSITVLKGKEDIWLLCDGCKVINSPYVQFTKGGCPVKVVSMGGKRLVKVKTKYLQMNDFRSEERRDKKDRKVFLCPALAELPRAKLRKRRA